MGGSLHSGIVLGPRTPLEVVEPPRPVCHVNTDTRSHELGIFPSVFRLDGEGNVHHLGRSDDSELGDHDPLPLLECLVPSTQAKVQFLIRPPLPPALASFEADSWHGLPEWSAPYHAPERYGAELPLLCLSARSSLATPPTWSASVTPPRAPLPHSGR